MLQNLSRRVPLPAQIDRVITLGGLLAALVATPIVIVPLLFLLLDEISAAEFVFWLIAAVIILGALGAVLLPNIVHATLALVVTLLAVAGIYLLLSSEFLALVQVLIFGGGVTILLLFGLMMTKAQDDPIVSDGAQKPFAFGVGALLAGVLTIAVLDVEWADEAGATGDIHQEYPGGVSTFEYNVSFRPWEERPFTLYKGSSVLFYAHTGTGDSKYNYSMAWVELPSDVYMPEGVA